MKYTTPQTLVKVGRFDNSLEDAVRKFGEQLTYIPVGLGNTVKYATFKEAEEPYLLMISQQIDKIVTAAGYNVILTITSYSDSRNQNVADQFERETGVDLSVDVPEQLKRQFALMGRSFQVFEKNPREAMAYLSGMI